MALDPETVLANLRQDIETIAGFPPLLFPNAKQLTPWRLSIRFTDIRLATYVKSQLLPRELVYCIFLADPPNED